MSVIIVLSALIVGVIAVAVWGYNKYICISEKTAREIEILGYILLFSVVIWEMVIKNILSADFYDSGWLYLEQKLLVIYLMLQDVLTESSYNAAQMSKTFFMEDSEYLKRQLLTIDVIEAVLTVLSTVCIAIGRFQDLRSGTISNIKQESISKNVVGKLVEKFTGHKTNKYQEKYKPDKLKYTIMLFVFICIRFIPTSFGNAAIDDATNDLAVGAAASVLVTWMLDSADCIKKNKARAEKQRMIFGPHTSQLLNLAYYVSREAIHLGAGREARSFSEWLSVIVNPDEYSETSESIQQEIYQEINARVLMIRETAENLMQQYTALVETDVVDTDDFAMYAGMQMSLCDSAYDRIRYGDLKEANTFLDMLLGAYATFFDEEWVEEYSEADAKG